MGFTSTHASAKPQAPKTGDFQRVLEAASSADPVRADGGKDATSAAQEPGEAAETESDDDVELDDADGQNRGEDESDTPSHEPNDGWVFALVDAVDDPVELDPSTIMTAGVAAPIVANEVVGGVGAAQGGAAQPEVVAMAGANALLPELVASPSAEQAGLVDADAPGAGVEVAVLEAADAGAHSAGRIVLPTGMTPQNTEVLPVVDLSTSAAVERLTELIDVHLRSGRSPTGGKQLSLLLYPEGLGRLRILAQTDTRGLRLRLQLENADAARLLERMLPQMEARLAAQMAMPVQLEVITDEHQAGSDELIFSDGSNSESGSEQERPEGDEEDLVDEWTQALEEPLLERGQQLHVVV
jgi:hypothetical protein